MAKKRAAVNAGKSHRGKKLAERPLTIWDREKYFDATFTRTERSILREKLMDVCGYGADHGWNGIPEYCGFERDIERPAEKEVWPVFCAEGFTYERDQDVLATYALIHVARQLRIDYKGYAKNLPKLPIDGFVRLAKETFREFTRPRNTIELKIHERKLWGLWCEWREMENERTGCGIDSDFFAKYDWRAIHEQVVRYNETRPKLVMVAKPDAPKRLGKSAAQKSQGPKVAPREPLRLVHSI